MIVMPKSRLRTFLEALRSGVMNGAIMRLGQADIVPDGNTDVAMMVECDFSGYASVPIVWGPVFSSNDLQASMVSNVGQFERTAGAVSNAAYTVYVTNAAGTVLCFAERLISPRSFGLVGDALALVVPYNYRAPGVTIEVVS